MKKLFLYGFFMIFCMSFAKLAFDAGFTTYLPVAFLLSVSIAAAVAGVMAPLIYLIRPLRERILKRLE
jgi:hypothetical protein